VLEERRSMELECSTAGAAAGELGNNRGRTQEEQEEQEGGTSLLMASHVTRS
jgi:hypothetical protein